MEALVPSTEEDVLRVGSSTPPQELASAIAHACYGGTPPTVRAIGAAAVNQAVKAFVIANQFVATRGMNLVFRPGFQTLKMNDGQEVSAIVIRVLIA